MADAKVQRLLLAETAGQVEELLARFPDDAPSWIALGPEAQKCLAKRGLPFRLPEDFHRSDELTLVCRIAHERLRRLCDLLDGQLCAERPELAKDRVRPFLFHIFPLTLLFDGLVRRIFQLRKILDAHPGAIACLHRTPVAGDSLFEHGFSNRESLWGHVAALSGWNREFSFLSAGLREETRGGAMKKLVRASLSKSLWGHSLARTLAEKRYADLPSLILPNGRPALLSLGNRVEWKETWPLLREEGWNLLSGDESSLTGGGNAGSASKAFSGFLESDPQIRDLFRECGIDFFPLLKDRLLSIAARSPEDYAGARKTLEKLRRRGLKGILTSSAATGRHHLILRAAQSLEIPVLLWQHGFVVHGERINQLYDYSDRMTADATLVYGEGARVSYERHGENFPSRLITVGSAQIENLSPSPDADRRKILYATTNYFGNYWYFGFEPVWSDNLFFRDQEAILDALLVLQRERGAEITVKLHPSEAFAPPPWAEEIKRRAGWRVIRREASFTDLARESGTVLLDLPSTTLLQAIALGRPLFALMRHWSYHPDALNLLKKRAVCEDSAATLMARVSGFLDSGSYEADLRDLSFLRAFGSANERPLSRDLALEAVRTMTADARKGAA